MKRFCLLLQFSAFCLLISPHALAAGLSPREEFFENEVRPLLVEKCQECHDGGLQESDLRLDSRAYVLQGGISGPAAIARNIEQSNLIKAVLAKDDFEQMPPDEPLSENEIAILKKWIRIGLPWTSNNEPITPSLGDQKAIAKAAQTHWAFQPIGKPQTPVMSEPFQTWILNPIDAFVAASLSDNDLLPSESASRSVLIRRLYYDIIGLPPTAEQIGEFLADQRPTDEVVNELVESLLSNKHHGERWARYWLDLARYADTRDWQAQAELRYPYAYTYRDYIINSLNDDKPYDQFIREQIAADYYTDDASAPQLAALGLLTVGPQFRNNKLEQAADKIDVVCRGLMGITVSCARCHDHKYDPVPIEDFYSLYGIFASTIRPDQLPEIDANRPADDMAAEFDKAVAEKRADLQRYKLNLSKQAQSDLRKRLPVYFKGLLMMSLGEGTSIRGVISKLKVKETAMTPLDQKVIRMKRDQTLAKHPIMKPFYQTISTPKAQFNSKRDKLFASWMSDQSLNLVVRQQLKKDKPKTAADVVMSYANLFDANIKRWASYQKANPDAKCFAEKEQETIRQVLVGEQGLLNFDPERVANASRLLGKGRKNLGDLEKAITEVEATHPGAPPRAMTLVDVEKPIQPFVFLRGEPQRKGDRVPRQFLSVLSEGQRKPFKDGSGRRELAESIADPDNPLTARIFVNRVWARYFGAGLVQSLDDFGLRSSPPSHPELLDWLAHQFIENGWSMKWLHRMITTSKTYSQSSQSHDKGLRADPENRLLWRQNRRRLDFEAMRDSMLAVADSLDPTLGGRSVRLSDQPFTNRRSVYAYIDRIELDPMLRTFDFASPTAQPHPELRRRFPSRHCSV